MNSKKILIIDDEFPVRYLVEHQLQRNGFEAISAKDGPSGIEAAHTHKPDLIVLDIMMPNMNGFEVCQKIRDTPSIASTPIIFLTACITSKHKLHALKIGADDFLVKPFQPDEFLAHISTVLQQKEDATKETDPPPRKLTKYPTQKWSENTIVEQDKTPQSSQGKVVSLFSPKGGVGTTTLAINLSEAMAGRESRPVLLLDLDLPLGGIAPTLDLYGRRHIVDLLNHPAEEFTLPLIRRYSQRFRNNLFIIPAPTELKNIKETPCIANLKPLLNIMIKAGYHVILDLGSTLSNLTVEALRQSGLVYVVTSGQPVANKLHEAFMSSAPKIGLQPQQLLPVINDLHGTVDEVDLSRLPVAQIPHLNEGFRSRLWQHDPGLGKMVSVML